MAATAAIPDLAKFKFRRKIECSSGDSCSPIRSGRHAVPVDFFLTSEHLTLSKMSIVRVYKFQICKAHAMYTGRKFLSDRPTFLKFLHNYPRHLTTFLLKHSAFKLVFMSGKCVANYIFLVIYFENSYLKR